VDLADRIEVEFYELFASLGRMPRQGHTRIDLTRRPVLFFLLYSFLIVYRPDVKPIRIMAVLRGRRNVKRHHLDRSGFRNPSLSCRMADNEAKMSVRGEFVASRPSLAAFESNRHSLFATHSLIAPGMGTAPSSAPGMQPLK
jgi:plasmid stabilization system protein ParE